MTQFLRDPASDREEVVTPLMLDGTYLSRNFATLGPLPDSRRVSLHPNNIPVKRLGTRIHIVLGCLDVTILPSCWSLSVRVLVSTVKLFSLCLLDQHSLKIWTVAVISLSLVSGD